MTKPSTWKRAAVIFVFCAVTVIVSHGQTFTTLHSFDGTDGAVPVAGLVQATNGNLYGMTYDGGPNNAGTVFKIAPSGALAPLYNFMDGTDGAAPYMKLVQATDGNFYGTNQEGGPNNAGTVFKITPSGTLTTLHSFDGTDGNSPFGWLVQATNGNLYGTTYTGGANDYGTVFKITPGGTLTTLHSFDYTDGYLPYDGLVQATNGNFYGTTAGGGANYCPYYGCGTVFEITADGTLTTLHSFCAQTNCTDGAVPFSGLVQGTDGNLYGTTSAVAGGNCSGGCGTVFKITPSGTLTTIHIFSDNPDGAYPGPGALVQATDGNFYGTTNGGGVNNYLLCPFMGCGTVFKITPSGTLTTLHNFLLTDGAYPSEGLVQDTDGNFYGTTAGGGTGTSCTGGCGTVFSLSVGLSPFVKTLPTFGKVGAFVKILGTNLTGVTSVTFNGTAATFTVVTSSLITATVPTGASTGSVIVRTASGTLTSNQQFRIEP